MSISFFQFLVPFSALFINILALILLCRYFPKSGLLKSVSLGYLFGLCSIFLLELFICKTGWQLMIARDSTFIIVINIIIYSCFSSCYFNFISLGETARRVRLLRELFEAKEGLSLDALLKRYNAKEIVGRRLNWLINNGQIVFKGENYYIGNHTMLSMVRVIEVMKFFIVDKKERCKKE